MIPLLDPKEIMIKDSTYMISKFDAISGRKIVTQYPMTAVPKINTYSDNEAIMLELMSFVAVKINDAPFRLTTKELIKNHVPDWEILMKLESEVLEYNCSFLQNGRLSNLFDDFALRVQQWILKTLTASSAQSSVPEKPPLTN